MATLPTGVYLRPGSSVFHLRIGVPKDLQQHFRNPKTGKPKADAYRASLRTSNRDEAITKALKLIVEYRDRFDALRAKAAPAPFVTLTSALVRQIADVLRHQILQADDNVTFLTPEPELKALGMKGLRRSYSADLAAMKRGDLQSARAYAERTVEAWGIRVDWSSPEGMRGLLQIARASMAAWQDVMERKDGAPIDTPPAPEPPALHADAHESAESQESPKTLRDVVPAWIARNAPKANAVGRTDKALALFEQAVGRVPLTKLTKATGATFVDFLLDPARGWSRKTAGNHATCITSLANVAVSYVSQVLFVCLIEIVLVGLKQWQSSRVLPAEGAVFLWLVAKPFVDPPLCLLAKMRVEVLSHLCFRILLQPFKVRPKDSKAFELVLAHMSRYFV
ncbi:hypothetical protein FPJ27_27250 [Burkholderia sp. MS455]|uniref:DUF6538 domain-containing protein n=1 Tax=Burkholderia sp. MS455 TaxID=2811788 RepID=UPI00195B1530|nr:DUF6538 domain-containing protein [Burkholderia sp. MS455]QRR09915.1 hypothetical protein FPJ27_27250 [Burkholderia sp. MS455]